MRTVIDYKKTQTFRAKGISLVVSQHMVKPIDVSNAIDILVSTLAKMIDAPEPKEETRKKAEKVARLENEIEIIRGVF